MSEMAMIRAIEADDKAGWLGLWTGYQRFYEVEIDASVSDRTFARLLDPGEPMGGRLAFADGRPVGLVHFVFHHSTWTSGDYCYLQDLFVDESARGQGIGRALIEEVCAVASRAGASRVHWLTHQSNRDAMALYDRLAERSGFVQYRRILP